MPELEKYSAGGWSRITKAGFVNDCKSYGNRIDYTEQVIDNNRIYIYPFWYLNNDTDEMKNHRIRYKSDDGEGFTLGEICNLVVKACYRSRKFLADDDDENLFCEHDFSSFDFDRESNHVYPHFEH